MKEEEINNKTKVGVAGEYQGGINGRQGGGRLVEEGEGSGEGIEK